MLLPLAVAAAVGATVACETPAPVEPAIRPAPRHPIQEAKPWVTMPVAGPDTDASAGDDARRITPGPNSRVSPTPDMAPRVEPTDPVPLPSPSDQLDQIRRDLQQQRERERAVPDPPKGTIKRPGTIKPPGTIEVPR